MRNISKLRVLIFLMSILFSANLSAEQIIEVTDEKKAQLSDIKVPMINLDYLEPGRIQNIINDNNLKPMNKEELRRRFGSLVLKEGIKIYEHEYRERGETYRKLIAAHKIKYFYVLESNAFLIFEQISSAEQAKDFWRAFNQYASIVETEELYLDIRNKCEKHEKCNEKHLGAIWIPPEQYASFGNLEELYLNIKKQCEKNNSCNITPDDYGFSIIRRDAEKDWIIRALVFTEDPPQISEFYYYINEDGQFEKQKKYHFGDSSNFYNTQGLDNDGNFDSTIPFDTTDYESAFRNSVRSCFVKHGVQLQGIPVDIIKVRNEPRLSEYIDEKDLKPLSKIELKKRFGSLVLKNGVRVYEKGNYNPVGNCLGIAEYKQNTFHLCEKNAFLIFQPFTAEKQIQDFWNVFNQNKYIIKNKETYIDINKRCAERKICYNKIRETPLRFGMSVIHRPERNDWIMEVLAFEDRRARITQNIYRFTQNGRFGKEESTYLRFFGVLFVGAEDEFRDLVNESIELHKKIEPTKIIEVHNDSELRKIIKSKQLKPLTGEEIISRFDSFRLKKGVKIYEHEYRKRGNAYRKLIVLYKRKTFYLNEENAFLVFEHISSKKQFENYWELFHPGGHIIYNQKVFLEIEKNCRENFLSNYSGSEIPENFGVTIKYKEAEKELVIKALVYDEKVNKLMEVTYRLDDDGRFAKTYKIYFYSDFTIAEAGGIDNDPVEGEQKPPVEEGKKKEYTPSRKIPVYGSDSGILEQPLGRIVREAIERHGNEPGEQAKIDIKPEKPSRNIYYFIFGVVFLSGCFVLYRKMKD
jgi:hypothetical protein